MCPVWVGSRQDDLLVLQRKSEKQMVVDSAVIVSTLYAYPFPRSTRIWEIIMKTSLLLPLTRAPWTLAAVISLAVFVAEANAEKGGGRASSGRSSSGRASSNSMKSSSAIKRPTTTVTRPSSIAKRTQPTTPTKVAPRSLNSGKAVVNATKLPPRTVGGVVSQTPQKFTQRVPTSSAPRLGQATPASSSNHWPSAALVALPPRGTSTPTNRVVLDGPKLATPSRLAQDTRQIIDSRTTAPQTIPDAFAGPSTTPGADALSRFRREQGITDPLPGRAKEQLANNTADLAGNATRDSVQQWRNAGQEDWKAHYDYAQGDHTSHYSSETGAEDPAPADTATESTGVVDAFTNWVSSVVTTIVGNPAAKGVAGNVAGGVAGTAAGILTSNNTVEGKTDEANGIIGLFRQGKKGTISAEAAAQLEQADRLPTHDGAIGGGPFTRNAVGRATGWGTPQPAPATPSEMTGQPAEPGQVQVKDLKAKLEKYEAVQSPDPTRDWAINYGDTVQGNSPIAIPRKAKYTPPLKDPVKPDFRESSSASR